MYHARSFPNLVSLIQQYGKPMLSVPSDIAAVFETRIPIINPKPDRRSKDWNHLPTWEPARFLLILRIEDEYLGNVQAGQDVIAVSWIRAQRIGARYGMLEWNALPDESTQLLLEHMNYAGPEKPLDMMERLEARDLSAIDFLDAMINAGELGAEHVERMIRAAMATG